jgi:tRNA pseudouridine38-40 synthase
MSRHVTNAFLEPRESTPLPEGWRRLKLILEWDGTSFAGWQVQSKGERTVQGVLERALEPLGVSARPMAAGRTDAGVHALGMVAHVDVQHQVPAENVRRALNARLPDDVRVLSCTEVDNTFHSRFSCAWRSYTYRILNARTQSALERHRMLWVPQRLEVAPMRHAARHLEGEHDFAAFASQEERQTVRTVYACEVRSLPIQRSPDEQLIEIHVVGESFLRHMVRGIVGTLLEVGFGRLESGRVAQVLSSKDRAQAGKNVASHGLYFTEAGFEPWTAG